MFTPDRRIGRRDLLLSGAATAAFGPLAACGFLGSKEKQLPPTPTAKIKDAKSASPTARIETLTVPDKLAGSAWEIRNIGVNPISPEKSDGKDPRTPVVMSVENTIFIRTPAGFVFAVDAREGGSMWKSETPGGVLAADSQRFVFTSETDYNIGIFDTQTHRRIASIPPQVPGLPKEQLAKHWIFPAQIGREVIILPYRKTVMGTYDGFIVLDKKYGKVAWKSETFQQARNHQVLALINEKLVVRDVDSERIVIFDAPIGTALERMSASKKPGTNELIIDIQDNLVATLVRLPSVQTEGVRMQVMVHDLNKGETTISDIINAGWFDRIFGTNRVVCAYRCDLIYENLHVAKIYHPWGDSEPGFAALIEAPMGPKGAAYSWVYAYAVKDPGTPNFWARNELIEASPRIMLEQKGPVSLTNRPNRLKIYQNFKPPYTENLDRPDTTILWVESQDETVGRRNFEVNNIPAAEFMGKVGGLYVFGNWNEKYDIKPSGNRKLFAISPDSGNVRWERDLGTPASVKVVIAENQIFVVGESLLGVDPLTGSPQLIAFFGSGIYPKQVTIAPGRIIVATSDNRLIAFPIN